MTSTEFIDQFGGISKPSINIRTSSNSLSIVTLVLIDERGREHRHYLPPWLAALYLTEVVPFTSDEPRIVRAKIIWGSTLDNWTY